MRIRIVKHIQLARLSIDGYCGIKNNTVAHIPSLAYNYTLSSKHNKNDEVAISGTRNEGTAI